METKNPQAIRILKGLVTADEILADGLDSVDGPPFDMNWLLTTLLEKFEENEGDKAVRMLEAAVYPETAFVTPDLDDYSEGTYHVLEVPGPVLLSYSDFVLVEVGDELVIEDGTANRLKEVGVKLRRVC